MEIYIYYGVILLFLIANNFMVKGLVMVYGILNPKMKIQPSFTHP